MTFVFKFALIFIYLTVLINALPTSIVEEVKSDDINNKKVKRAQTASLIQDDANKESAYYPPMKRGGNMKADQLPLLTEWDQQRYRQGDTLQSPLYATDDDLDDKSFSEYEKGYRYGTNKDKLDEALENAILKSEIYGDPAVLNQYRYYGAGDDRNRRRRRRNAQVASLTNRLKRDVELNPEDILAILTLMENERERNNWQTNDNKDIDMDEQQQQQQPDDEDWLDAPVVYPHVAEHYPPINPKYYYDTKPRYYEKRGRWAGFNENRRKRFMVAKRNDPTRELRYLNGPSRNDFYTLSELLANQREPNLPVHQRLLL